MTTEAIKQISEIYPVNILIYGADDDEAIRLVVGEQMKINNIQFRMFSDGEEFRENLINKPNICFIDYNLTPLNGNMLTKIATEMNPDCRVTMITGEKKDYDALWTFHNECGGKHWLYKGEPDEYEKFVQKLVSVIQEDITYETARLEKLAVIYSLQEEAKVRKKIKAEREENANY